MHPARDRGRSRRARRGPDRNSACRRRELRLPDEGAGLPRRQRPWRQREAADHGRRPDRQLPLRVDPRRDRDARGTAWPLRRVRQPRVVARPVPGRSDFTNSIVSRLVVNNGGQIQSGEYVIPSSANYQRFCSNFLVSKEHGFERDLLLTNEEATDSVNRTGTAWPPGPAAEQAGVVVALDVESGEYRTIYGMGRHNHENSVAIPGYGYPRGALGRRHLQRALLPGVHVHGRERSGGVGRHRAPLRSDVGHRNDQRLR